MLGRGGDVAVVGQSVAEGGQGGGGDPYSQGELNKTLYKNKKLSLSILEQQELPRRTFPTPI